MKFTIDGREYEPYQLSNEQVLQLYKSEGLTEEQRSKITEMIVDKFGYNLCKRDGVTDDDLFVRFFSNFVNGRLCNRKYVAEKMCKEHRYLQEQMFLVCLSYIRRLAENYEEGRYDGRNEYSCKTSSLIIQALNGKNHPI
jgi:hypothetical protein